MQSAGAGVAQEGAYLGQAQGSETEGSFPYEGGRGWARGVEGSRVFANLLGHQERPRSGRPWEGRRDPPGLVWPGGMAGHS